MAFTPLQSFRLDTDLSYDEVCRRVGQVIGPPRGLNPLAGRSEPYLGSYEGGRFAARRDAYAFGAPKPTISGKVAADGTGSTLHLRMRPGLVADIFMVGTILLFATDLIRRFIAAARGGATLVEVIGDSVVVLMGAFLFVALFQVYLTVSIRSESRKSREFFAELIEAKHVGALGPENQTHGA